MSKGMDLFIATMQEHQAECIKNIDEENNDGAFISFIQYLWFLFPIREKLGLFDTINTQGKVKDDTVFGALKFYYEAVKHRDDPDIIYQLNVLVPSMEIESCDGLIFKTSDDFILCTSPSFVFGDITNLINLKNLSNVAYKQRTILLHDKYLKGKEIKEIMTFTTDETLKVYI